ncbi:MAG TPA: hypothetical protein VF310_02015 [Vicinamibacteria bacterium]
MTGAALAAFVGLQFGGSLHGVGGGEFALGASPAFGVTASAPFAESWSVEALYSRDSTRLEGPGPSVAMRIERVMAGVSEEHDFGRTRFFGVGLAGATRLVPPAGFSARAEFTLALGLGVKHLLSDRFGIRAEALGFYTVTRSDSALFCNGDCLFNYRSNGLVQGDLSAGLMVVF